MRRLAILVLAALAAHASAQVPTTVYAQAKRWSYHVAPGPLYVRPGTYPFPCETNDWFTITGDTDENDGAGNSIPWGMTWGSLCDNHWVYKNPTTVTTHPGDAVVETKDWYVINKYYGTATDDDPDDDDPSNGDDIIAKGPKIWVRTCDSQVTNSIRIEVVHP